MEAVPAAVSHATAQPIPQLPSLGAWPVSTPLPVNLPPPVEEDDGENWPEEERQPVKDHVMDFLDKVMHKLQEIRMSAGSRNKPSTNYHPPPSRDPPPWKYHNKPVPGEHRPIQVHRSGSPNHIGLPLTQQLMESKAGSEPTYRRSTITDFSTRDPSQFTRLKIALGNPMPAHATELFKYQILVDHLKLEEACLVADSYLNSLPPYSDTMAALNEKYGQRIRLP
ncbi:hypothetical protein AAFF_G00145040 [Aldrovandia affinis]|uniref:Uncharacterized protein n=1 Tax=Aldrovandia affinis TaxID=143900 RepID=A0AAD7T1T2_9TELE|nr:hypothetical protein AAFF_G00145040 [Aldrovandia affinis]